MAANLKELKEKLAYSCNILAYEGHWDNILGHVSVRIPGQNRILMKPHSFGFEEIRPQHIIVVDIETGKKVEGKHERHSEVFIHTGIMKARPDVNCVVHSHPPYATALGATMRRFPSGSISPADSSRRLCRPSTHHAIAASSQRKPSIPTISPKPAIKLSRNDWLSAANRASLWWQP